MTRVTISTIAVLLCTTGTVAAGPLIAAAAPPPLIAPLPDDPFDGFYAGLEFGGVDGQKIYTPPGTVFPLTAGNAVGAFGGFNFQFGNLVVGPEVRLLRFNGLRSASSQTDGVIDLRARGGFAAGDFLAYGALGWSWATIDDRAPFGSTDLDGMNYGFGVEYNITEAIFVGADYTRRDVSGISENGLDLDVEIDTVTLRLGLRF
jgi:opacity protein-like surface antigen